MSTITNTISPDVQRLANDISARLAQVARDPPDLVAYLHVHAECVAKALAPRGFAYEMRSGEQYQRVIGRNLEDLDFREAPEQEESFRQVIRKVSEDNRAALLEPNSFPAGTEAMRGLKVEDAPAPDQLPLFNKTPFQHFFVPITLDSGVVGILRVWFGNPDPELRQSRLALLQSVCRDIELYLKARRAADVTEELTRLSTYTHLLEELAGDLDLETTSWNLVNYAREAVACDRVSIFTVRDYARERWRMSGASSEIEFEIQACSGLKKPHPRSEHVEVLKALVGRLLEHTTGEQAGGSVSADKGEDGEVADAEGHEANEATKLEESPTLDESEDPQSGNSGDEEKAESGQRAGEQRLLTVPSEIRPRTHVALVQRDPSKVETRPAEINHYFEMIPMNWATVLPLFDRERRLCGVLLFEGREVTKQLGTSIYRMRDLSVAGGQALGTALYWQQSRMLRCAKLARELRERLLATPAKRVFWKVVVPILAVIVILSFPIPYRIKGDANVIPEKLRSLPALSSARLTEVLVREGEQVEKDQLIAKLDTEDLEIQLRQANQEYERYMTEADNAFTVKNEIEMQIARLNAAKVAATIEKLHYDIEHSAIRSPFDGVVVGPQNLPQRVGRVMRMGETVVEVAEPLNWDVKVRVREEDIVYLEAFFDQKGAISGELRLAADPTQTFPLQVVDGAQFAYGLDTSENGYSFALTLPLKIDRDSLDFLKVGFAGKAEFQAGRRPVAYVLFNDFIRFIKLRWL